MATGVPRAEPDGDGFPESGRRRAEPSGPRLWVLLAVIAAGGATGALARYAITLALPAGDGFPWATLMVNAAGSALIGVVMVLVGEGRGRWGHPLARPFAGVGVLGGFTTFSAYALDFRELLARGEQWLAPAYAGGTVLACFTAVWAGAALTRSFVRRSAQ
ncbi:fluoride efflux transporter CrcB [Streptomyces amakusaensis]|uniref:Fluoride-specific ion channel FluC n=1 Tax=Streptomyces amakusaensis TaxID=67271 RepID=A0ABW0ASJ1_9ACTN